MNKTAIKNFAVSARRKLIAMAADKAGRIGITATTIAEPSSSGSQFAIFPTGFGTQTRLDGDAVRQRASLVTHIKSDGYDAVMEEVAYTWFNRLIAVRFMEVNDYLPTRVRVLSSETAGKFEPDLVTQAPNVDLGFTEAEKEEIYARKDDPEKSGDLFRMLFVRQCNALGTILPELFEQTADYTELLLDLSWDKPDGVIRDLLSIDEADFREAVEIVGWLYQYYNTEPKD
ncbi:MAG: restriction endonuclease, partial [Oscillospiraceae bacterium]